MSLHPSIYGRERSPAHHRLHGSSETEAVRGAAEQYHLDRDGGGIARWVPKSIRTAEEIERDWQETLAKERKGAA